MKEGRPTKYNEEILQKANVYLESFIFPKEIEIEVQIDKKDGQAIYGMKKFPNPKLSAVPYIEELAFELEVDDDTIVEWAKIYPDFSATIKRVKQLQKVRLLDKTLDKFSATGAIFQLKVNHAMIETNRTDFTSGGKQIVGFNYLIPEIKASDGDDNPDNQTNS